MDNKILESSEKDMITSITDTKIDEHIVTTTQNVQGYIINKYIGLVSGETVIGTGFLSELDASFSDLFGVKNASYSNKIIEAKECAIKKMIANSIARGGNAIVGVSFEVLTFSRNLIGVSVNGTSVIIKENEGEK